MSAPNPRIQLTVPRTTQYLGMVRRVVAMAAERVGFDGEEVDKIELAIDEACSNSVLYAQAEPGELEIEVKITDERFTVVLRDDGAPFDFDARGNFEVEDQLRSVEYGGLGIYIIKNFMDDVQYRHTGRGNELVMAKLRPVTNGV
jgi:serine/threonine-protein kinase RsbW